MCGSAEPLHGLPGPRNPYPGKLGVIEEGALADLLLVDRNPIANIKLIEDPARNFVVIMRDGNIYKNTVKQWDASFTKRRKSRGLWATRRVRKGRVKVSSRR